MGSHQCVPGLDLGLWLLRPRGIALKCCQEVVNPPRKHLGVCWGSTEAYNCPAASPAARAGSVMHVLAAGEQDRRALFHLLSLVLLCPPRDECCPCSTPGTPGPTPHQQRHSTPVPPARLSWCDRNPPALPKCNVRPVAGPGLLFAKAHKPGLCAAGHVASLIHKRGPCAWHGHSCSQRCSGPELPGTAPLHLDQYFCLLMRISLFSVHQES